MWKKFLAWLGKLGKKDKEIIGQPSGTQSPTQDAEFSPELLEKIRAEITDIVENTDWQKVSHNASPEEFQFLSSMFCPILPKHYQAKVLILTIAANQECDYQMVDLSQYEEKQLVHYVVGKREAPEKLEAETAEAFGVELDEPNEWHEGMLSAIFYDVDMYYYEEMDYWDFVLPEDNK